MQIERKYAIGFDSEWDVVAVRDMVRDAHRVVMVAHTDADGDAVGSVTGMYQLLCQIGVAMVTPMLPRRCARRVVVVAVCRHGGRR